MTFENIQEKAIGAVIIMNTAITNLRLYPITSAMISQTIDRLLQAFTGMLAESSPLILAESERMLLVGGEPSGHKDQERPQVRAFIELLINLGIKSITIDDGLTKEELSAFLQAFGRKPEAIRMDGGLEEILARQEVLHIRIDEKIYVAKDKDQQIVASMDIKDDDIMNFLMEADPNSTDLQNVRDKAKDPEWISGVFQNGMKHLKEQQESVPNVQLSANLVQMVRMLEKIASPADLERIAGLAARSVTEMDSDMISMVLSRDVQNLFGGRYFEEIVTELDEERFAAVADGLAGMAAAPGERSRTAAFSHELLMKTDKGRKLEKERQARIALEKEEREKHLSRIVERLQGLLKGEEIAFRDQGLMADLPALVRELYTLQENQIVDALFKRLTEKLISRSIDLHSLLAESLSLILHDLFTAGRIEQARHLAERLAGWLRSEQVFSPACKKVCLQLIELERALLERDPFAETNPILDILSTIQSGRVQKDPALQSLARDALRELAGEELLDVLFEEFRTNRQNKQKEAGRSLARLGAAPTERLLDMLRESEDSAERVRILQVISEIGAPSVPAITERMTRNEAWYVLRNLVYALGRVGGEAQAADLAAFLLHDNQQLQQEAMKSLQRIGGKARAEILLSLLPEADDRFKLSIIEMLGNIKAREAVPLLLELLQSKAIGASALKADLDEKICIALGGIGAEEALPALMEIAKSKGFFTLRSFPEKVKLAAGKATKALLERTAGIERLDAPGAP